MRGKHIFRTITLRTMLQNRTRTIVTIIGVILATAMLTAVTAFGSSIWRFLVDYAKETDGNWHMAVLDYPAEEAEKTAMQDEFEASSVVQNFGFAKWENGMAGGNEWGYLLVKSLPQQEQDMVPLRLQSGRLPENDSEILLPWFLPANEPEYNQTKIGDTMELEVGTLYVGEEPVNSKTQNGMYEPGDETLRDTQKKTFTVTGFYEFSAYFSGSEMAFEVYCGPGEKQETVDLYLRLKSPDHTFGTADKLAAEGYTVPINYSLLRWLGSFTNDNVTSVFIGLLALIIGIIMIGAVSLIYNAFSISVRERTTQFGLLSSIGATKKQLRKALLYEAVFVSVIGIPVGVICGITGIGITLHYISFGITSMLHGVQRQIALRAPVPVLALTVLLAVVTIVISAWVPSGRIRRISPMEAIRASRDIRILPRQVKTGKGIQKLFGVPGMLAQKNYKRDRKKYRSTVFSLTMSIVLFVSAVSISDSLKNTGSFVLEAPDVEIKLSAYEYSLKELGKDEQTLQEIFQKQPDIEKTYHYRELYQYLSAEPEMLSEYALTNAMEVEGRQLLDIQCIFLPDERFDELSKAAGVDIDTYWADGAAAALLMDYRKYFNPDTQRYEKMQLFTDELPGSCTLGNVSAKTTEEGGDEDDWYSQMEYTPNFNISIAARIDRLPEGIVDNYESQPFVILPMSVMESLNEAVTEAAPYCITAKTSNYKAAYEDLDQELKAQNLTEGVVFLINLMESYERDRNFLLAVNVLSFGFTTLISLIALANVFNTVSTNLLLRRREFAMLRSMGLSPKSSRKMLLLESLNCSVRSVVYGSVLSIGVSLLTWEIIRIGADNLFRIPWKPMLTAAVAVYLMVAGTMALTMRRINKVTICEELKMNGM